MAQNLDIKNIDRSCWKEYTFDQIASSISKRVEPGETELERYVGLEHLDTESIHIKRWGSPSDVEGTKLLFYKGDLIFGKRRAYQRKAAIAEFDGICSAHAFVLRPNPRIIEPDLFPFFIHSDAFMNRAIDISVGGLSPTINWSDLKAQKFLLPPKDQQKKLAELLWAGNNVTEKYQKLKLNINDIINATGKSLIGKANKNTTLGTIIQLRKGKKPSVFLEKDEKYLPYLSTDFLRVDAETGYVNPLIEKNILICEKGNILILWDGSNAGEIFKSKKGVVSSTMAVVIIKDKSYLEDFLYYMLHFNSEKIRSGNTGSAIPHVSQDILYALNIPVVSELQQQIWIKKLSELFETKLAVERMINASSQLQVQLINQIFSN